MRILVRVTTVILTYFVLFDPVTTSVSSFKFYWSIHKLTSFPSIFFTEKWNFVWEIRLCTKAEWQLFNMVLRCETHQSWFLENGNNRQFESATAWYLDTYRIISQVQYVYEICNWFVGEYVYMVIWEGSILSVAMDICKIFKFFKIHEFSSSMPIRRNDLSQSQKLLDSHSPSGAPNPQWSISPRCQRYGR